jgi:hypothetical protein
VRCALALALALFVVGCGTSQQAGIRKAIRSSPGLSAVRAQRPSSTVTDIRIAHSDPRFATALFDTTLVYLHRTDRWHVVDVGTTVVYASCLQTPRGVVMELFAGWCFGARGALTRLH